jgi:steroid 5-alpha reductase family enzyme
MKIEMVLKNRVCSYAFIFIAYVLAAVAGYFVFGLCGSAPLLAALFAADVAATLVVWIFSLLFANSSVYDPYWSVAPPVIVGFIMVAERAFSPAAWLIAAAIGVWSVRLTLNWAVNFSDLTRQDWRYTRYKEDYPRVWFISNLFGIHLVPTFVVFLCLIPAVHGVTAGASVTWLTLIGAAICLTAVLLETVSDIQMYRFKGDPGNRGAVNRRGLWRVSRHPNYLGEISMWWGVWVMGLSAGTLPWYALSGPVSVTLLFVFISIPLMEKRQLARKAEYAEYVRTVGMLLPRLTGRGHK